MSISSNGYPKLRPLDIRHHQQNGQDYILLRDPLQLSDKTLLVPQPLAMVLAFCDGTLDAAGMAAAFTRHYRYELDTVVVDELLAALDEALLLDNVRARTAQQAVLHAYRAAPHRPLLLAERGYPGDPAALRAMFDALLAAADVGTRPLADWPEWSGLLSPHIDYPRGGHVYAQVWKHAAEAARAADLVVIFGTDHYGDDPFTLTRQSYATPYGVMPTDQAIVDALAAHLGEEAAFAGELRHRDEHSIKLVTTWLHHMRGREPVPVVPILTGSLTRFYRNGDRPDTDPQIGAVLAGLRQAAQGRRTLVIASGDLSHVGPAFGGAPLDAGGKRAIHAADRALIDAMVAGDSARFYGAIKRDRNANNVCGVSPIFLTMELLANGRTTALRGEQFGYATCPADDANTSVVTVCGVVFH